MAGDDEKRINVSERHSFRPSGVSIKASHVLPDPITMATCVLFRFLWANVC